MCVSFSSSSEVVTVELYAPCGKRVALAFPDVFRPRADDEDLGAALGVLVRALGYERRGWLLVMKTTVTTHTGVGVFIDEKKREVWSK